MENKSRIYILYLAHRINENFKSDLSNWNNSLNYEWIYSLLTGEYNKSWLIFNDFNQRVEEFSQSVKVYKGFFDLKIASLERLWVLFFHNWKNFRNIFPKWFEVIWNLISLIYYWIFTLVCVCFLYESSHNINLRYNQAELILE